MLRIFLNAFFLLTSLYVFSQEDDETLNVSLTDHKSPRIVVETSTAKISFLKSDVLAMYKDFDRDMKDSYIDSMLIAKIKSGIDRVKKSKGLILKFEKGMTAETMDPVLLFIKVYAGAKLFNKSQAEVVEISTGKIHNQLSRRQLIDSPEGAAYLFSFKSGDEILVAEEYGSHTLILESE